MAKVTEYSRITKMKDNDILLVDGPDGTRTILQTDASKQMGGEVIMVNETAGDSTKVVINTTDEDIELATMADLEPVEEDVSELKTQLNDLDETVNGIGVINYTEDKNIDSNGEIIDAEGKCVSDKIPYTWTGSTVYHYGAQTVNYEYRIAFYDASDVYLGGVASQAQASTYRNVNAESTIEEGTVAYVRFSFQKGFEGKAVKNSVSNPEVYYTAARTIVTNGLSQDVDEMQSDIADIQEDISDAQTDITTMQSDITTAQEDINTLKDYHIETVFPNWILGGYSINETLVYPINNTIMRTDFVPVFDGLKITPKSGYKINVRYYTIAGKYLNRNPADTGTTVNYSTDPITVSKTEGAFVRLQARKTDNGEITDPNDSGLEIEIERYGHESVFSTAFDGTPNDPNLDMGDALPKYLALVACREIFEEGKINKTIGFLYRTVVAPHKLYYASGKPDNIRYLCDWDLTLAEQNVTTGRGTPNYYSFAVTDEGDIVCVYRGEIVNTYPRANPIVYPHDDLSNPVIVDLQTKPCAWISNSGMFTQPGEVWFGEYIRDWHEYAYVWKIVAPYTNAANWTIMKTYERDDVLNPSMIPGKIEHVHHVAKDPFTGIIYVTCGDHYAESRIDYYDTNGTWGVLREADESVCRQLNFIFTKTYIYWASDAHQQYNPETQQMEKGAHRFFRAVRDVDGLIDLDNVEAYQFDDLAAATVTYHVCYLDEPNCILILDRHESSSKYCEIPFRVWNIEKERLEIAGTMRNVETDTSILYGFRTECTQHYPTAFGSSITSGFSLYSNFIECLTNPPIDGGTGTASDDSKNEYRVNSLTLKVSCD